MTCQQPFGIAQPYLVTLAPVTAAVAVATDSPDDTVLIDGLTGIHAEDTGIVSISGSGPSGPIAATFECTVSDLTSPGV